MGQVGAVEKLNWLGVMVTSLFIETVAGGFIICACNDNDPMDPKEGPTLCW